MKSFISIFFQVIFIISLINCKTVEPFKPKEGELEEAELTESVTEFLLSLSKEGYEKMVVEITMTHPSKYTITFNEYDLLTDEDEDNEARLRKLSSDFSDNQTDLIEHEEIVLGKNKLVLNLEGIEEKNLILSVFKKDEEDEDCGKIYLKYKNVKKVEEDKYSVEHSKVNLIQNKDILNISFSGIKQVDETLEIPNFSVVYSIKLFDKETLTSNYENIYAYAMSDEDKTLLSTEFRLKGEITKETNYIKLKAPLNNNNEQLLLINARVKNEGEIYNMK